MKTNKNFIVAAIDVGSHNINMKIAEINKKGIKVLESITKTNSLGRDTFNHGQIQFQTLMDTCETLMGFKRLMKDYGVNKYQAVATSALREAENRDYVLDKLRIKTDLDVKVLHNSEEHWLTYKTIDGHIPGNYKDIRNEGTLVVDMGSGSLEVSVYDKGHLSSTYNLRLGALRLREVLSALERDTLYFYKLLEEFLSSTLDRLHTFLPLNKVKHFVAFSESAPFLVNLLGEEKADNYVVLTKEQLGQIYRITTQKTGRQLANELAIGQSQAELLLPVAMVFKRLLEFTNAKEAVMPLVSLTDGLLCDYYDSSYQGSRYEDFLNDIVASARNLGKRYMYDEKHAMAVERNSLLLFDRLKKVHGLNGRYRILLQLAAILHDIGKFINFRQHHIHSYNIIRYSDILGLSEYEFNLVASVARYHTRELPSVSHHIQYKELSSGQRLEVSKLAAIIRLADALDQSHQQKVETINARIVDSEVRIIIYSKYDTTLEEWSFKQKANFFIEVFGFLLSLKKRGA